MPKPELNPVLTFTGELPDYLNQAPKVFAPLANKTVLQWNNVLLSYNSSLADVNAALIYMDEQVAAAEQKVVDAGTAGAGQVVLAANQVALATAQTGLASGYADEAEIAKNTALAFNNIQLWSTMTGAVPAFSAVVFNANNSKLWVPKVDIPNIAAAEPTVANSTWIDYYDEISAGEVVSDANDVADAKLPNVAWMKSRGVGNYVELNAGSFNQHFGVGDRTFFANVFTQGPVDPFSGYVKWTGVNGEFGILTVADVSTGKSYTRLNSTGYENPWKPLDNPAILPPESGGTGETTLEAARVAMGAAKSGAIADAGITMAGSRMLGASEAGAPQEWTSSQVRDFISARVASSKITSATARIAGRVASGTGDLQELTAAQVLDFLGCAVEAEISLTTVDWVRNTSRVNIFKIMGRTLILVDLETTPSSSSTTPVIFNGLIPAAYRSGNQTRKVLVSGSGSTTHVATINIAGLDGSLSFGRTDAVTASGRAQAFFCY